MRQVGDQAQLVALARFGDRVAFPHRSVSALSRQSQLLARKIAARLFDPLHNRVGRLELGALLNARNSFTPQMTSVSGAMK
jgi:hypothetical protein